MLSINPLLAAVTKSPAPVPAMAPFDASSIIFFRLMSSPLNTSLPISIAPLTIPPPAYSSLIFYPLILKSLLKPNMPHNLKSFHYIPSQQC